MSFDYGSLPDNLAAFCDVLRRRHGFRIGPGELSDAARAAAMVDIGDVRGVRHALRPILSGTFDEARVFDGAFADFFLARRDDTEERRVTGLRPEPGASTAGAGTELNLNRPGVEREGEPAEDDCKTALRSVPADAGDAESDTKGPFERSAYSPLAAASTDAPGLTPVGEDWAAAARIFVSRVHLGLSRRWRSASSGTRFDLRRTLRASLQHGGEPLAPRWLRRRSQAPRFVVLVDGSRSMSSHSPTALRLAVALAGATPRMDAFTFSTSLQRITRDVRRASPAEARRLEGLDLAWGGGTSIGACLREFLQRFGARVLGPSTVAIIASDGLDVGNPQQLRDAVAELHRRADSVVWLNPLLDTEGYEPSASGMRAARPYITTFSNVKSARDLVDLARQMR
jgi:uncharacterized protein with von Willebrand factor type A (vWA) domain